MSADSSMTDEVNPKTAGAAKPGNFNDFFNPQMQAKRQAAAKAAAEEQKRKDATEQAAAEASFGNPFDNDADNLASEHYSGEHPRSIAMQCRSCSLDHPHGDQ